MQIKNLFKKNPANKFQNHFLNFKFFSKIVRRFLKDYMQNDLSWSYVSGKYDYMEWDEYSWHISDEIADSLWYGDDQISNVGEDEASSIYSLDTGSDYEYYFPDDD